MPEEEKDNQTPVDNGQESAPDNSTLSQIKEPNTVESAQTQEDFTASEPETPPLHPELAITQPPKEKKSKRPLIMAILLVLILGLGAGAYWYANKTDKPVQSTAVQNPVPDTSTQTETKTPSLNTVAYTFKAKESDPFQLLWRPASGGDKSLASTLQKDETVLYYDVYKNSVAVATTTNSPNSFKIWISQNGGKTYKSVYAPTQSDTQITSMKFASDGSGIVFGEYRNQAKNTVKNLDIASLKTEDLFEGEKAGVFVYAYSPSAKQVIYSEGCFNCDGNIGNPIKSYDLSARKAANLLTPATGKSVSFQAINGDFTEILAKDSSISTDPNSALSAAADPPFDLVSVSLKNKTKKTLGTFGEKPKQASTATFSAAGYMSDGATPYFALKNQIFKVSDGKKTLVFESVKDMTGVYYVSQDTVVTGSGTYNDFLLTSFSSKEQKSTTILNGNANTYVFGVTID